MRLAMIRLAQSSCWGPRRVPGEASVVNPQTGQHEIVDRDYRKVKHQLLNALTNFGNPIISVVDANYRNRGELYMHHEWVGVDLQFDFALKTLTNIHAMWKRPVHIETREEGKPRLLSFDGKETQVREVTPTQPAAEVVGQAGDDD